MMLLSLSYLQYGSGAKKHPNSQDLLRDHLKQMLHNLLFFIQDMQIMLERSDRLWSIGEGNGKPLQYSCLENPMNSMKRQNDRILKKELPRSVGAQHVTGDQWRNNSRKNEGMEPKQKQYPAVDVTGDRSKV